MRIKLLLLAGVFLCLSCLPSVVQAQVSVTLDSGQITVTNVGFQPQQARMAPPPSGATGVASTTDGGWVVMDNVGNTYATCGADETCGGDEGDEEDIILVDGYQKACGADETCGGDEGDEEDIILVDGYQEAIQMLRDVYNATVRHDSTLNADLVSFPDHADPYTTFFTALLTDSLHGRPLIDFFRLAEIASLGVFDEPPYEAAVPQGLPFAFPSDPYYRNQRYLLKTRLLKAHWHPATPQQAVRVAIIDSGVGTLDQAHEGLDGASIAYENVAPTTGFPRPHGLSLMTLLAERSDEGSGPVGLLGAWDSAGCYDRAPLLATHAPEIISYNVGDFGPSTLQVARAIRRSIAQGVDAINLSLRLPYSPSVEAAIREALDANILVVAAAGNYAPDAANKPATFPANLDGVIAVGAANDSRQVISSSANTGLDLLAPGEDVLVGGPGGLWREASGTSFAAPHVLATLVLMRTARPDLTPVEALDALQRSASARSPGGVGYLDAFGAVNRVLPPAARVPGYAVPHPHQCNASNAPVSLDDSTGYDAEMDANDWGVEDTHDTLSKHSKGMALTTGALAAETLETALTASFPNPFSTRATLRYDLGEAQYVRLVVYNMLGQEVQRLADGWQHGGTHTATFHATELPSGTYFVRLQTDTGTFVRSMVLAR